MRVLVTGTDGLYRSIMTPYLIEHGHDVTGLDTGFYRRGWLFERPPQPDLPTITKDIRDIRAGGSRGFRCSRASCGTFQRPARRAQCREHLRHQLSRVDERRTKRKGRRRQAVRLCLVVQHLRRRFERCTHGGIEAQSADRVRGMQSALRAGHARARRRRFLADLHAQCDRLRRLAPDALRHRPQQPRRPGLDDEEDRDDERRHAVASARPCARHLPVGRVRAASARREGPRRDIQRRRRRAELPRSRNRRSRRKGISGMRGVTSAQPSADNRSYRVSFAKIRKHLPDFRCRWSAERGRLSARSRVSSASK